MLISAKKTPSQKHPEKRLTKFLGTMTQLSWHIKLTIAKYCRESTPDYLQKWKEILP